MPLVTAEAAKGCLFSKVSLGATLSADASHHTVSKDLDFN